MSDSSEITYRVVTPDDAAQLLEIYAPYVKNTAISFEYEVPSVEEFKSRIAGTLKKFPYIAALQGSKIVGYSYASAFKTREAYKYSVEMTIYVRSECKRSGIGHGLYSRMEKILKKQGILNLNACISSPADKSNTFVTDDSMLFHQKEGFSLVGRFTKCGFKFSTWHDMIWMQKLLDDEVPRGKNPAPFVSFAEIADDLRF